MSALGQTLETDDGEMSSVPTAFGDEEGAALHIKGGAEKDITRLTSGVVLWFCFFGVVYFATSDRGPTRICCRSEFLRICILHF